MASMAPSSGPADEEQFKFALAAICCTLLGRRWARQGKSGAWHKDFAKVSLSSSSPSLSLLPSPFPAPTCTRSADRVNRCFSGSWAVHPAIARHTCFCSMSLNQIWARIRACCHKNNDFALWIWCWFCRLEVLFIFDSRRVASAAGCPRSRN